MTNENNGGPVNLEGQPYVIGNGDPELFIPNKPGNPPLKVSEAIAQVRIASAALQTQLDVARAGNDRLMETLLDAGWGKLTFAFILRHPIRTFRVWKLRRQVRG